MIITNATLMDINTIFELYKIASDYQKNKKTVVVWPEFNRGMVTNEILENRQFKLLIDDTFACVWAITFSDAQIWEKRNEDAAIYMWADPKLSVTNCVIRNIDGCVFTDAPDFGGFNNVNFSESGNTFENISGAVECH